MSTRRRITATVAVLAAAGVAAAPSAVEAADAFTFHNEVQFSDAYVGPCIGELGTLTVDGTEVFHVTQTGSTFRLSSVLRGDFSIDFDDASVSDVTGHFVSIHQETVNYAQFKDYRIVDDVHAVAVAADGTRSPVHSRFAIHFGADGSVEVTVDWVRCGGRLVG